MNNLNKLILTVLVSILLIGCANIVAPSGGERDRNPPQLLEANPPNKSIKFKAPDITLTFDEFVSMKDINSKLLISPPMSTKPTIRSNGKRIKVEFQETLKENTTYTINFGNAIVDYNEGNAIDNFSYVFSTGLALDSASINGKVLLAQNGSQAKKAYILLYSNNLDVTEKPPSYFTRTDENGNFKLDNIKIGKYYIYGLGDQNANYFYDLPNELIGFSESPLNIKDSINPIIYLDIFKSSNDQQKVLDVIKKENGVLKVVFAMPVEDAAVKLLSSTKNIEFSTLSNSTKDTLTIYNSKSYGENVQLAIWANKIAIDTVEWAAAKQAPKGLETKVDLNVSRKGLSYVIDKNQNLEMTVNFPIDKIDETKIYFQQDTFQEKLFPTINKLENNLAAKLSFSFENNTKYKLTIAKGAIIDKANRSNKTGTFLIQIPKEDSYSKLAVSFIDFKPGSHYLLELVGPDKKVASTTIVSSPSQIVNFPELRSGNYKLRAIEDANNNGRWDTGNFNRRLQPERIIAHSKTVVLKPGWENEVEFSLK